MNVKRLHFFVSRPLIGIMKIVFSVHEGFQNVPQLYGSKVRKPGKVTGFTSGLKEGGKVRTAYSCGLNTFLTVIEHFLWIL